MLHGYIDPQDSSRFCSSLGLAQGLVHYLYPFSRTPLVAQHGIKEPMDVSTELARALV